MATCNKHTPKKPPDGEQAGLMAMPAQGSFTPLAGLFMTHSMSAS